MNVKNVFVEIKSDEEVFDELKKAVKEIKEGKPVQKKESIVFSDLNQMRSFLTNERLRILHAIKEKNPKNLYQLAKITGKDYSSVYKNVKALRDLGLIDLHNNTPEVNYHKINVEIVV